MIKLHINGVTRQLEHSHTISEMTTELGLIASTILIEYNGVALRRHEWPLTSLQEGDHIEILQVAAGG